MEGKLRPLRGLPHLVHQTKMRFQGPLQGLAVLVQMSRGPEQILVTRFTPKLTGLVHQIRDLQVTIISERTRVP